MANVRKDGAALTLTVLLMGAVVGAFVLGFTGVVLSALFVEGFMSSAELEGLGPLAAGVSLGAWTGGALGSWVALRLLRRPAAGLTALVLGGLMPVWLLVPVGVPWITGAGPSLSLTVAGFVVAVLLARGLALVAVRGGSPLRRGAVGASVAAALVGAALWGRFFVDISRG